MTIDFQPHISRYFSKEGAKEVRSEAEERKRQVELSRDILAKNIILPAMARFQFAEYVEIDVKGNVAYRELSDLFSDSWEFFRDALPSPRMIPRELRACSIKETDYEDFLKERFNGLCKDGLIAKTIEKTDLEKEGKVYQPQPGVWKETETGNIVPSKTVERESYRLKEGTDWHELLRKIFSHENPIGISSDEFNLNIGYTPYENFFVNSPPLYQDFNSKLERAKQIKERETERRSRIDPELAFRLMRLHSSLMQLYSTATADVIKSKSKIITLRPPYILERVVESLPSSLGAISYDASELSRRYNIPWLKQLQENVNNINSREPELRSIDKQFLKLEKEQKTRQMKGRPKEKINYSAIKTVLDETVFKGLAPFTIQVRDQLENSLGYGKRDYVFI